MSKIILLAAIFLSSGLAAGELRPLVKCETNNDPVKYVDVAYDDSGDEIKYKVLTFDEDRNRLRRFTAVKGRDIGSKTVFEVQKRRLPIAWIMLEEDEGIVTSVDPNALPGMYLSDCIHFN